MMLKENSKARKISLIMIGFAITASLLQVWRIAENAIEVRYFGFFLSAGLMFVPIVFLVNIAMRLYFKNSDTRKLLTSFTHYFIIYPITLLISSLLRVLLFNETINIIQIVFTISEIMFFFLPAILGISILESNGTTHFLRNASVIEAIFFAIATILTIPKMLYLRNSVISFGSMSLTLTFLYMALFIISKDIEENENTVNITDLEEESIAKNVIFTIITFGVYSYIWLYRMSRSIKCLNNDKSSLSGELICLMFVPFYKLYWVYTRAKTIKNQADCRSVQINDGATLYSILSLLGLNIVSVAFMQNDLNTLLKYKEKSIICNNTEDNSLKKTSDIERIIQLSELKERGILTEEEYRKKKQEILDRI